MKNMPNLVNTNNYLKNLIKHLKTAPKTDPYLIIIDSLSGIRKVDLREIKSTPFGKYYLPCYTGNFKYPRAVNTLKKYGIVIDDGSGYLSIEPRFRNIVRYKKYQWVGYLSVQKRAELEGQLKSMSANRYIIEAVLENIDNGVPLKRFWEKMPRRKIDESFPQTYSTFCRIVRKYQNELGY